MEWETIAANWERMRVVARERWPKLTYRDTELIAGNREDLIAVLAWRYKWDRDRAQREVQIWQESFLPKLEHPSMQEPLLLARRGGLRPRL